MWRCDIPDSNGVQQSIYIYLGTRNTGMISNVSTFIYMSTCGRRTRVVEYNTHAHCYIAMRAEINICDRRVKARTLGAHAPMVYKLSFYQQNFS